ncbi:Leucine-rich repeat and calponin homology domain-containing protein 2 [Bagarius yarrelli]|uniref:Leucine-rich repeat and calponin homology domain-containing protein 2 n=1 Tax=Bagarius yarrelli TaxID=175774 RepID=A0A556UET2_BAGYA|nr:Leucine-rich repeat and calponin homology domain-containing protein 2 [Bagarius yarrelli]
MAASQGGAVAAALLQGHQYPAGPHWSANGAPLQPQPPHTARSLDRALDDAASSGVLNISGRKLRDYPGLSYDLTDTTHADLSKNRFAEIPPEVCMFAPLESLNLYHNCIKMIPEAIVNLQMLTYLNISRNQLTVLPKFLFNLPLRVLVDISCNEIQVLPTQMGKLYALRELNIRRNCIQVLPDELSNLPLIRLDFSCNKITEIPTSYRKLCQIQHIVLDNNPMQSPPAQPSLSCSFEGSLKSENGDDETKWPELPPILNQNEERRRNKYLRKDYLKVQINRAAEPSSRSRISVNIQWQI